jgi:drug/metabolite transporter (DMT)-like permease
VKRSALVEALVAAVAFGVAAPLAKRLGAELPPLALAGLLYLGAGLALLAAGLVARAARRGERPREAPLERRDLPVLAAMIACGGVAGPVLLMVGLARLEGQAASLLLNLEVVLTALGAALAFHEHLGRRGAAAVGAVTLGAALLALRGGSEMAGASGSWWGALAVAGACAAWAADNNFSRLLSARDPMQVARWKALAAGAVSLALAALTSARLPPVRAIGAALAVGAVGYGASLVLYLRAQRGLGAARTAALFATAPFVGAAASLPLLGERPTLALGGAAALMALGAWLLATEHHEHTHRHESLAHAHLHTHDEHHQHVHTGDEGPAPHSHPHVHAAIEHAHPHAPDLHHRHRH